MRKPLPLRNFSLLFLLVSIFFLFSCYRADKLAQEGLQHLEQGKDVTALTLFEDALEQDSENPIALYGKGCILIREPLTRHLGREMLERSLRNLSDKSHKKNGYMLLAESVDRDKGIETLERAIKRGVHDIHIYKKLAAYQVELKKNRDAADTYLKASEKYPKEAQLKADLGLLYAAKMKDYQKAFEHLQAASQQAPQNIDHLFNLSKVSYLLGKREESKKYIQAILDGNNSPDIDAKFKEVYQKIQKYRWRPAF